MTDTLTTEKKLRKGDELELKITALAFGGLGLARHNNQVVFVRGAVTGQIVRAVVTKRKKSYLEALSLEILSESENYIEPKCRHFKYCGGCSHQQLQYKSQLSEKQAQVEDIFYRLGGYKDIKINPILGCDSIWHYRNKMEFTFSSNVWYENSATDHIPVALGLHVPKRYDKILDISECLIQDPVCNDILDLVKEVVYEMNLDAWNIRKHTGFLRNLVIRKGFNTGEIMLNFVTSEYKKDAFVLMVQLLRERFPEITSIVNNITRRHSGSTQGEKEYVLFGNPYLSEKIAEFTFEISANSFFQTNTNQTEKLYDIIKGECGLTGNEIVYDLFCGTGSISIFLSKKARDVYGFELVPSAVSNAEHNAQINTISNCRFFEGDLMNLFQLNEELQSLPKPNVIVIDPPRAGMHPKTVPQVIDLAPEKIVYVSCNPSTQVRDLNGFTEQGYTLMKVQPVDMFPHTPHIETVAALEKNK